MHRGRGGDTCGVTGLESAQLMPSPQPLHEPPDFPEPHFLSLSPRATASPAHHNWCAGAPPKPMRCTPVKLWDSPVLGSCENSQGEA